MHDKTAIQGVLEAISAALNDDGPSDFDVAEMQSRVDAVVSIEMSLRVDGGGGLHDPSGARVGAIRRAPSGEWIIDGQNPTAPGSQADIPAAAHEHREPGPDDNEQR